MFQLYHAHCLLADLNLSLLISHSHLPHPMKSISTYHIHQLQFPFEHSPHCFHVLSFFKDLFAEGDAYSTFNACLRNNQELFEFIAEY